MRLSVFHPETVNSQLLIDLKKIYTPAWSDTQLTDEALNALITQNQLSLYVAMFNQRHIAAAQLTIEANQARVNNFVVRDLTRRRGVGKYLLAQLEATAQQQGAAEISVILSETEQAFSGFLVAMGYQQQEGKWCKAL